MHRGIGWVWAPRREPHSLSFPVTSFVFSSLSCLPSTAFLSRGRSPFTWSLLLLEPEHPPSAVRYMIRMLDLFARTRRDGYHAGVAFARVSHYTPLATVSAGSSLWLLDLSALLPRQPVDRENLWPHLGHTLATHKYFFNDRSLMNLILPRSAAVPATHMRSVDTWGMTCVDC